jgi:hypothetical protein
MTRKTELHGRTPRQVEYLRRSRNTTSPSASARPAPARPISRWRRVDAFERELVQRIVLTRPAVEAGERLGFLPGDLAQKVDPYLRPLYDALYDLMGFDKVAKLFERSAIEIAPLAYMRGRTLNHAFIILDEAQNTTPEQMKMFLTRIGIGAKAVVTGDVTQIDLQRGQKSGLIEARRSCCDVRGIAFTEFQKEDVVRHPLVARIVSAYEAHTAKSWQAPSSMTSKRLNLSVQYACNKAAYPSPQIRAWVRAALDVDEARAGRSRCASSSRRRPSLNRDYRGKDYATNVLSFPYEVEPVVAATGHLRDRSSSARPPSRARRWRRTTRT